MFVLFLPQTFQSIISWLKIARVMQGCLNGRDWLLRGITCQVPSLQIMYSETCEHVAEGPILCRWWHTNGEERKPHGSPYICSPWCFAVTGRIAVQTQSNCWTKSHSWWLSGSIPFFVFHTWHILSKPGTSSARFASLAGKYNEITCIWFNL